MKSGICPLCLKFGELCESHYMSRFNYKLTRAVQLRNPNPVSISAGKATQSQSQVKDYVLCPDCEKKINIKGESWVVNRIPKGYGEPFPLQEALLGHDYLDLGGGNWIFQGKGIAEFDMDKLVYFAASIFWRGAAHVWPAIDGDEIQRVNIGSHQECLRKFLLDGTLLPEDLTITVYVWPFEYVPQAVWWPTQLSEDQYWFYIPGLAFVLQYGDRARLVAAEGGDSYHSLGKIVVSSIEFSRAIWKHFEKYINAAHGEHLEGMLRTIKVVRGSGQADS